MARPTIHRRDWKVTGTFERRNQPMVIEQKYALYVVQQNNESVTMESHPLEETRVRPASEL